MCFPPFHLVFLRLSCLQGCITSTILVQLMYRTWATGSGFFYHGAPTYISIKQSYTARNHATFSTYTPQTPSSTKISPLDLPANARFVSFDVPQRSDQWFSLRKDKLTTSAFSSALGFWKGKHRSKLWHEKAFASDIIVKPDSAAEAMKWGQVSEAGAIERYKKVTGREVHHIGFAVNQGLEWLGASPDGILGQQPGGGILEVKCPYNKGRPGDGSPWTTIPFYYMPQLQGQMEILDMDWVDVYCWMPRGSTVFRVNRDTGYWKLMHGILREFWWDNVVPARESHLLGADDARNYEPDSRHRLTGLLIWKSRKMASDAKLICREIGGEVDIKYCG